jgi:beta-galactosidase
LVGGRGIVKKHPLFNDLPVNAPLNCYYEALMRNGNQREVLQLQGEELIVGGYHCYPQKLGTMVGLIPCGKGYILFSTLDIYSNLNSEETTSAVAKKLLCNFINYSNK